MIGPPQQQFTETRAHGARGQPVLSPVAPAQEAGQENVTTQLHLMEERSVRDQAKRLENATQRLVKVNLKLSSSMGSVYLQPPLFQLPMSHKDK